MTSLASSGSKMQIMSLLRVVLLGLVAGSLLLSARTSAPSPPATARDTIAVIAGTWDWADRPGRCQDNPQTIAVSADEKRLTLTYRKPVNSFDGTPRKSATYRVFEVHPGWLRTQMEGETRKTPKGDPVVWDIIFVPSADKFCWHRTDWSGGACTKYLERCPGLAP